jgi:hypothetical protein
MAGRKRALIRKMRQAKVETCDLNRVDHAMIYVMQLVYLGLVEFSRPEDVLYMTDESYLSAAQIHFLDAHEWEKDAH